MSEEGSARAGGASSVIPAIIVDDESGNSERDWEIFEILCKDVSFEIMF